MSNLTTEVFGDMNYLYEHIANRDAQELNENSDHYDKEFAELVEDILATISSSMVYEGYSANGIISFLADSPEEDIIEKYLSFDENIIIESVVSEDYIVEQLEIFDFAISEGWRDKLGMGILNFAKRAPALKSAGPLTQNAATRLAMQGKPTLLTKAKVGLERAMGPGARKAVKGAVTKVKDIAKGAKAALTSPTAKKIGLGALGAGALVGLPYAGAKLAGAGSGGQGPSPTGAKPTNASDADFTKGSALAKLGGREGRIKDGEFRTMGWSQQSKDRYNKAKGSATPPPAPKLPAPAAAGSGSGSGSGRSTPSGKGSTSSAAPTKSKTPDKAPAGETAMQTWARTNPKLAAKVKLGQSGYDEISQKREVPGPNEKKDQTPTTGPEATDAQKSQAGAEVAAIQAKEKAAFEKKKKELASSTQKESYDAYDLVLEYLFNNGHADTIAEAEYLMTELDENFVQSLVENYEANLLAEEVAAWVNGLVEEGYDLSEYTWDDMVDYYFSEAK